MTDGESGGTGEADDSATDDSATDDSSTDDSSTDDSLVHASRWTGAIPSRLARRLGVGDAVVVGLGAMLGAGVFGAFGPAAAAAGSGLVWGLAVAAVVAWCNATSSARLAAVHPESGGTYVYARHRLGPGWGALAGWAFVTGKTASCAAMALTFAAYATPSTARPLAMAAVAALAAVNLGGVRRTSRVTGALVLVVLGILAVVVVACLFGGQADVARLDLGSVGSGGVGGVLRAGGLLFFAFARRLRPHRHLGRGGGEPGPDDPPSHPPGPRSDPGGVPGRGRQRPGRGRTRGPRRRPGAVGDRRTGGRHGWVGPGGANGSGGGVVGGAAGSARRLARTVFAMAADGELPGWLAAVDPRTHVPARAEVVITVVVMVVVAATDVRGAIGFSSVNVLAYYALANASALKLYAEERRQGLPVGESPDNQRRRRWRRVPALGLAALGLVGCLVLAVSLPVASLLGGVGVLALAAGTRAATRRHG